MSSPVFPVASLNVTLDGVISELLKAEEHQVVAVVRVPIPSTQQQEYLREQIDLGHVITSINSGKARIGIEQAVLGGEDAQFALRDNFVEYTALFTLFATEYLDGIPLNQLLVEGIPVGKLYAQNPQQQLNEEQAGKLLSHGFYFPNVNGRSPAVLPDGTVNLPLWQVSVQRPSQRLTKEILQSLMRKEIDREQLSRLTISEQAEHLILLPYAGAVVSVPLGTAGHEMVITDERHGDSRVAESDTHWEFFFELKGGREQQRVDYVSAKFYRPLAPHAYKKS